MGRLKILYVSGTVEPVSSPGGSVEGMRLLIKELCPDKFEPMVCAIFPSKLTDVYANAGAKVVTRFPSFESLQYHRFLFKIRGGKCLTKYFLAGRLSKILNKLRPDVLHINLLQKWDSFDLKLARRLGIKTVGHMRSLGHQSNLRPQDIAECDTVICVSKCVQNTIEDIYTGANTALIYNGADPARYSTPYNIADARHTLNLPAAMGHYLFSIGQIHPRKGHDTAIRALAAIRKDGLDAILGIVGGARLTGDHQEQARLATIAEQAGVTKHVFFLGQINEIQLVYRAANLIYALSHDGEAFGRVPIEAAFSKVPIIASRVGATPEIVQEGITGLLVNPEDIRDIKSKSIAVLTNSQLSNSLVQRAKEFAYLNFTSAICAQRISSLYTQLCRK